MNYLSSMNSSIGVSEVETRRIDIEEAKLALESSFAKKWAPTIVSLLIAWITASLTYIQVHSADESTKTAMQATQLARIQEQERSEREYGLKVMERYLSKPDLFDMTSNAEQAKLNLQMLTALAPIAVSGVLSAELGRVPPPSAEREEARFKTLSAIAGVQDSVERAVQGGKSLVSAKGAEREPIFLSPGDFTVYVQYPEEHREQAVNASSLLLKQGYRVPGIDKVARSTARLEVRYYRADQERYAQGVSDELAKALALEPTRPALIASSKQLPRGILEVWIP
jgi:hypothetical protein